MPKSEEEVREIVRGSTKVKALGTRHSFNDIADSTGDQISTERLNRVVSLDRERQTVTVEAGIRYGELCRFLESQGYALNNIASLPHISVAGACATATHGSGVHNGNLATAVSGIRFVTADGSILSLSRDVDGDLFLGTVVGLGGLGVVTQLTLDVEPSFQMTQTVYENLPFDALEQGFDDIMSCAYSVSLFTFWTGPRINQVWVKAKLQEYPVTEQMTLFGATSAPGKRSPLPDGAVENCTDQMGIPGPWCDRLPHFRMGFTPSSGEELQTEYFVDRANAWNALKLIDGIRDEVAPLLYTTEIRTIDADSFWMSPCSGRQSVAIHFTWKQEWDKVKQLLPKIEGLLAPFDARPHWGKLFTTKPSELRRLYPRLPEFKALLADHDPDGKFRNAFMDRLLAVSDEA